MNMRPVFRAIGVPLLLTLSAVIPVEARSVAGTVRDQGTNLPLANVVVKILETGDSIQTDGSGFYFFLNVPDGTYTFLVGKSNYQPSTMAHVSIPNSCCVGKRGNVNGLGIIDGADLSALVSYLTGGGYVVPCNLSANVNAAGIIDSADLAALVSYLTGGGYALPNCP